MFVHSKNLQASLIFVSKGLSLPGVEFLSWPTGLSALLADSGLPGKVTTNKHTNLFWQNVGDKKFSNVVTSGSLFPMLFRSGLLTVCSDFFLGVAVVRPFVEGRTQERPEEAGECRRARPTVLSPRPLLAGSSWGLTFRCRFSVLAHVRWLVASPGEWLRHRRKWWVKRSS